MISFKKLREACWTGYKQVGTKKKGDKIVPNCVPEEAPANAAGSGNIAGIGVGPDGEPGVTKSAADKYKKKNKEELKGRMAKFLSKFTTTEQYNKLEVENIVNKVCSNQEVYENQIEPIIKNLKRKQEQGTYNEEVGIKTFRYVVDNQIKKTVSEEFRNEVALELLKKYVKEYVSGFGVGLGTFKPMGSMVTPSKTTLSAQKIKTPTIKPDFRSTGEKDIKDKQED